MGRENVGRDEATIKTFGVKWSSWAKMLFDFDSAQDSGILDWILTRNGWAHLSDLEDFLAGKESILDAGCGNGRVTALLSSCSQDSARISAWDINESAAQDNLKHDLKITVEHVDLSAEQLPDRKFDFIYCQEVLHHLPSPSDSFRRLSEKLLPGGVFAVYVYGIKHPFREFSDEWVRNVFQDLPPESQIGVSNSISRLGEQLSSIDKLLFIDGLEPLGIPAGKYPVQKFFYDYFFKCFWNGHLGDSGSTAVNFDWFGPALASKHTLREVEGWFTECNLEVIHRAQDEYGITVHGRIR